MNKFAGLLIVVGLVAAGYANRDKIAALRGDTSSKPGEAVVAETDSPAATAPAEGAVQAGPHPAKEAMAEAARLYPGLMVAGSPLNKRFLALHAEAKTADPELLTRPDWPITLAERAMVALGGTPLARGTPAPAHTMPKALPGSSLDVKPKGH